MTSEESEVTPGESLTVRVELDIEDDWHLYGPNPETEFLIESTVEVLRSKDFTVTERQPPAGIRRHDEVIGQDVVLYEHQAVWTLVIQAAETAAAGPQAIELQVTVQACDQKRCLKPQTYKLVMPIRIRQAAE